VIAYQWRRNGVALHDDARIIGSDTDTLTILLATHADAGLYSCAVANPCGQDDSAAASLSIACSADFNNDGDVGTDLDIETFFACVAGNCCAACGDADFNATATSGPTRTSRPCSASSPAGFAIRSRPPMSPDDLISMSSYELLLALALTAGSAAAQQPVGLGSPSGPEGWSFAYAMSDDGAFAVGTGGGQTSGQVAFRWHRGVGGAGMMSLGVPSGATSAVANGVSNDGSVVSVTAEMEDVSLRAYCWTEAGFQDIGILPGAVDAYAYGVSGDGTVIVGSCDFDGYWLPFAWTRAGGLSQLPLLPGGTSGTAMGISRDGSTIVGNSDDGSGTAFAVRWVHGVPENLGVVPHDPPGGAIAEAVNADGSVVLGRSYSTAFRWTAPTGMQDLGPFESRPTTSLCANLGGDLIGGCNMEPYLPQTAFIWTPATGLIGARDYFTSRGVDMSRWFAASCTAISPDGRFVAGVGTHFVTDTQALGEAFIIELPTCGSADFNHDGDTATDADIEAFFACIAAICCSTCSSADFNGDGDIGTDADIEAFFRVLAGGAC
jgi:probable HAF family extracellular repeat protein